MIKSLLLESFMREILDGEGLKDWNVDIWDCPCEGECDGDDKIIRLGVCKSEVETKKLFLHEVAHATSGEGKTLCWHRTGWEKEYTRLLNRYMGNMELEV